MHEAGFYSKINDDRVKCELCRHYCVIKNGQAGLCGVRANRNGKLILLSYGYPTALNIEPIEKKSLFHFKPGTQTYSIATLGCNMKCHYCQNWELSQVKQVEEAILGLDYFEPEKIIEEALGNECQSISFDYNESTVGIEYVLDVFRLAKGYDLATAICSNGFYASDAFFALLPHLDAVNIELKSFNDDFYRDYCQASLGPVLENLKAAKSEQVHIEVTSLIIPGLTDDIDMLYDLAGFIANDLDADTPWHIKRFRPEKAWKMKKLQPTNEDIMYEAMEIGKEAGLKYIYLGNLPGDQNENTYCPACNELAIRRMGNYIDRFDNSGRCAYCDKSLDIIG